jgi:hypothetical protein
VKNNPLITQPAVTRVAISLVWLAPLCIMLGLVVACSKISDQVFDRRIDEGVIEYSISFPEVDDESITASLLPDKMTYSFQENGFASNFETAGGIFRNNIVANLSTRSLEHQIKVFRKKIKVTMNEADILRMLSQYPKMTVIKTDQTDTIAGYLCKKALIVFEEAHMKEIEVYYTDQIKMKTPNWCTQYHEIEGVLMAYDIEEFGIRMRLEAKNVLPKLHGNSLLSGSDEHESITREMMDVELAQLVETFEL